jgi:Protein of unknown function (DUF3102)
MLQTVAAKSLEFDPKRAKAELDRLAGEINWYEDEGRKTVMLALQYKLEIGRRLARAKKILPHGKFLSWARDQFGWTPRHVQHHLMLAEHAPQVLSLSPDTSLRMALALIRGLPSEGESELTVQPQSPPIHIIGEIEPGTIDRDRLLAEVTRLAGELGAEKMRWRIR